MATHYTRPYVPGAATTPGFIVVCVPGMRPVEVTEALAKKLTEMIIQKKIREARVLLSWFVKDPDFAGESDVG